MGSPVRILGSFSNKNYMINGAFDFAQRINLSSVNMSTAPVYYVDRWESWYSATSWASIPTITLVPVSPSTPAGIAKYTPGTGGTSNGVGAAFYHQQKIEGIHARALVSQNISVGFWVFPSSVNCTASLFFYVAGAEDDWSSPTNFYNSLESQTLIAGVWNYVSFTNIAMPSNSWQGISLGIRVTNFASVGVVGCYITEVMMNIGAATNPFVRSSGSIQAELELCERYCHAMSGSSNERYGLGQTVDSSHALIDYFFPTPMRKTPTPTYTAAGNFLTHGNNGSNYVLNAIGDANVGSPFSFVHSVATGTTWAVNVPMELTGNAGLTARIIYDAEL